ncbi:hypothetical protein BX600DRAFT_387342 [Xylariales sp. PMI_506]|nr:hypothetical protein BX600DRAFT_387342 [Xylariales sp. PMI_506]
MSTLKSILVLGPSGNVGRAICRALIESKSSFTRIAALNNTDRPHDAQKQAILADFQKQGMEIVPGTYNDMNVFVGFDAVVMAFNNFGNYLQPQIIDAAIEGGVRHFYPSEFGADITKGNNWTQRYYRDKVITREHLEKRATEVPDLGWTYIVIGRFTEYATLSYFGFDHENRTATIYGTENGRQSVISIPDTAKYTVQTMLEPFSSSGATSRQRTYRFNGETVTWKDIFAMLERASGSKWQVTYRPVEDALADSREAEKRNDDFEAMRASHRVVQGSEGTLLPQPYDNDHFPNVHVHGVEEVLISAETPSLPLGRY